MLIVTRRDGEGLEIGCEDQDGKATLFGADGKPVLIRVVVQRVARGVVHVGIEAPKEVIIFRDEVAERVRDERNVTRDEHGDVNGNVHA